MIENGCLIIPPSQLRLPQKRLIHPLQCLHHFIVVAFLHQNIVFSLDTAKGHDMLNTCLFAKIGDHIVPRCVFIIDLDVGITGIIVGSITADPKLLKVFSFFGIPRRSGRSAPLAV